MSIASLREHIEKTKAKNYPIGNKLLDGATDYIKNSYFKMLAVVLLQKPENSDGQTALFERLIAGSQCDHDMADYMRQAMEIKIEEYEGFTEVCRDGPLKYRFLLDTLLLTAVTPPIHEEQEKLAASLMEVLKVRKDEVEFLAALAKAILTKDILSYYELTETGQIKAAFAYEYHDIILDVCNRNNERITVVQTDGLSKISPQDLDTALSSPAPIVVLSHLTVSLSDIPVSKQYVSGFRSNEYQLYFHNKDKVIFDHCTFIGSNTAPIKFSNCKEIVIRNCEFRDFRTRTIEMFVVEQFDMTDSTFQNCIFYYSNNSNDWYENGSVIWGSQIGKCTFSCCTFIDSGGCNERCYFRAAFISNCKTTAINCSFINCWHYNGTETPAPDRIDPDNDNRRMFTRDSVAIECQIENSAKFN